MTSATTSDEPTDAGRSGRWTIAIFALVGLGLGLLYFSFRTPTYEAEALVNVANPVGPLADQVNVANSREVLDAAARTLGYEPQIDITAAEVSQLLTIIGTAADAQEAANSANAVANTYVQAQLGPPATIALPAQVPASPVGLGPLAFAALGTALGAAVGVLVNFFQTMGGSRRRDEEHSAEPRRERTFPVRDPGSGDVAAAAKEVGWDASRSNDLDVPGDVGSDHFLDHEPIDLRVRAAEHLPPSSPSHDVVGASMMTTIDANGDAGSASSFEQLSDMAVLPPHNQAESASSSLWSPEIEPPPIAEPTKIIDLSSTETAPVQPPPAEFIDLAALDAKRRRVEVAPRPESAPQPLPDAAPAQPAPPQPAPPQPAPIQPAATAHPPQEPPAAEPVATPASATPPLPHLPAPTADQPTPPAPAAAQPAPPQPAPLQPTPTAPSAAQPPGGRPAMPAPPADLISPHPPPQPAPVFSAAVSAEVTPLAAEPEHLSTFERQALQTQYETALYESSLAHEQALAHLRTEHEQQVVGLTTEVASLNKKLRVQTARLKNRAGTDQNRVGDLEAQLAAVEADLVEVKETLENERIAHTKRVTEQRGVADRALDNARRQYREELSKHGHTHRGALAGYRDDLDRELAADRAQQAAALEAAHQQYEEQLQAERSRAEERAAATDERHDRAILKLREETQQKLDSQMEQHRNTIATLRTTNEDAEQQLLQLERDNRLLRAELSSQRKQTHETQIELQTQGQRLSDELVLMRSELDGERERNAALRADVLRRSAEAHQAIDRAVEERTAQLAELEATVERQREYADRRVSEMSTAAEEQARESAVREASLTAEISRLNRQIESPTA